MRYILKQKHKNTCGVVAIVNILRSFGRKTSYKEILKEAGGLKKVNKRGMLLENIVKILNKHNVETISLHVTRKRMLYYVKHTPATVAVCYVWLKKIKEGPDKGHYAGGPHIVMMRKTGKAINAGKLAQVTGQRWRDTKKVWKVPPITVVCLPKKGGVH